MLHVPGARVSERWSAERALEVAASLGGACALWERVLEQLISLVGCEATEWLGADGAC